MSDARVHFQLQSFAKVDHDEHMVKITLLNRSGDAMHEHPFEFTLDQVYDKQLFTAFISNNPVQFINVCLDPNAADLEKLKQLTEASNNNWRAVDLLESEAPINKDPRRPPYKDDVFCSLRMIDFEGPQIAVISRIPYPGEV